MENRVFKYYFLLLAYFLSGISFLAKGSAVENTYAVNPLFTIPQERFSLPETTTNSPEVKYIFNINFRKQKANIEETEVEFEEENSNEFSEFSLKVFYASYLVEPFAFCIIRFFENRLISHFLNDYFISTLPVYISNCVYRI